MKLTPRDMEHPLFLHILSQAEKTVYASLDARFLDTMDDREAKAVWDAIEALTKVVLIQVDRQRAEIGWND